MGVTNARQVSSYRLPVGRPIKAPAVAKRRLRNCVSRKPSRRGIEKLEKIEESNVSGGW